MGVFARVGYTDYYGVVHRVDIDQNGYSGSVLDLKGTTTPIIVQRENLDVKTIFSKPVLKSNITVEFFIDDANALALVNSIIASAEGTYKMLYYKDGSLDVTVDVLADQIEYNESSVGRTTSVTGKDFSTLSGQTVALTDERKPIIEVFADILALTGYNLPFTTSTSWVNSGQSNTARDFLGQIYIDTKALREYASREEDVDRPILASTALELLCRNFKVFLKQANGRWFLDQLSAYDTPSSVLRTLYTTAGAFVSASNVNTTSAVPNVSPFRTNKFTSTNSPIPGLKRVSYTFNHRSDEQGIIFPTEIFFSRGNVTPRLYSQTIVADGNQRLSFGASVEVRKPTVGTTTVSIVMKMRDANLWWNNSASVWSVSPFTNVFDVGRLFIANSEDSEIIDFVYTTYISLNTANIPSYVGEDILDFTITPSTDEPLSITSFTELQFVIVREDGKDYQKSIQYQLEQTGNYSVNYDDGFVLYGDGPNEFSNSALRTSTLTLDVTEGGWYRRGSVTDWDFSELFTREIMEFQLSFVRNLNTRLMGDFDVTDTMVYDSTSFFFTGGSYNVYTGEWNANFVANAYASATATLTTNLITGNIGLGTGIYTSIANAVNRSLESGGLIAYRLAVQLDPGLISQVIVTPELDTPFLFEAGMSLRIVHPVTQASVQFTVSVDQVIGSNVITIVPQEIDSTFIVGSMVFLSQETLNAFITIGRNLVRIAAENKNMGELVTAVSGTVTSLELNLFASIRSGEDFDIIDDLTGGKYPVTVTSSHNAGVRTVSIQSAFVSAVAGSYMVGDSGMKQAELVVSPSGVIISVERDRQKNAIAKLSSELASGTVTSLPITGAITISLLDNQTLTVEGRDGQTQDFVVNGNQSITGASSAISVDSVTNLVDFDVDATVFFPAGQESARITVNSAEIDLRVEKDGVIASINISPEAIRISANKIQIDGTTTFSAGYNPVDGRWVAYQTTAPTTRASGAALVTGDEWFDTDDGNRLRVWNSAGSGSWDLTETLIDGNRIITGSITADRIDVSDLFAENITVTGSLTGGSGSNEWIIGASGMYVGQAGGLLATFARDFIALEDDASPSNPRAQLNRTGLVIEQASGSGDFTVNSSGAVVSKSSITANSLIVGTQTNKATISYTTNTARTLTIPNVGGNRTFSFIDENETITGTREYQSDITVEYGHLKLENSAGTHVATFRYNGTANRTFDLPNGAGEILASAGATAGTIIPDQYIQVVLGANVYYIPAELVP